MNRCIACGKARKDIEFVRDEFPVCTACRRRLHKGRFLLYEASICRRTYVIARDASEARKIAVKLAAADPEFRNPPEPKPEDVRFERVEIWRSER